MYCSQLGTKGSVNISDLSITANNLIVNIFHELIDSPRSQSIHDRKKADDGVNAFLRLPSFTKLFNYNSQYFRDL